MSSPWQPTPIPGLFRTSRPSMVDSRGSFTKILGEDDDAGNGGFTAREVFWSRSTRGVIRGLHVPLPPRATRKLVFVTHGAVRDFVLDLRRGSPSEGTLVETRLDAAGGGLVIPAGCAHGFEVTSDEASMVYAQEEFYTPDGDGGVHYSSAGIVPQAAAPVLSARDEALPSVADFDSPFTFA